nr:hypothetical protein [Chloroflexota bacterium]
AQSVQLDPLAEAAHLGAPSSLSADQRLLSRCSSGRAGGVEPLEVSPGDTEPTPADARALGEKVY